MESIVFFGKGGIGKSTISTNISVALAKMGHRVLHLGCDPKMDSALALTGRTIVPFSKAGVNPGKTDVLDLITQSPHIANLHCAEAGGPEPGIGCAGAAIASMLDAIKSASLLENETYSRIIFDVLGDVVCGGFAAPLKKGFAKKAIIISSEEILSLYAANNLLKMLGNFSRNGVYAAGIVLNVRDPNGVEMARKYAQATGLTILGEIYRDNCVYEASKAHIPALLHSPDSVFSKKIMELADNIEENPIPKELPEPLNDREFAMFAAGSFEKHLEKKNIRSFQKKHLTVELLKNLGIIPAGVKNGELRFRYEENGKVAILALVHKSESQSSMVLKSDWGAYLISDPVIHKMPDRLDTALDSLSCFKYMDFMRISIQNRNPKEIISGIAGKPMKISHALPVPFDENPLSYSYSFLIPEIKFTTKACFLVDYADIECRFNGGIHGGRLGRHFLKRNKGISQPNMPVAVLPFMNSNCRKEDLVLGNDKKIARVLSTACETIKEKEASVLELDIGCSPLLIYQDIDNVVSKIEKKYNVSIGIEDIHGVKDSEESKSNKTIGLYGKRMLAKAGNPEFHICLADFYTISAPLEKLLEEKKIKAKFQGTYDSPADFASASLYVFYNSGTLAERFISNLGHKCLSGARPFGFECTKSWLQNIYSCLKSSGINIKECQHNDWAEPSYEQKRYWDSLLLMLKDKKAAFILTEPDMRHILEDSQDFPVFNMLNFLSQTSMEIVLILKDNNNSVAKIISEFQFKKYSVFSFNREQDIQTILESSSDLKIVYSDLRDDARILSAGKIPFSSDILESGYDGAIETLRRIADLYSD